MIAVVANNYLKPEHIEEAKPLFEKLVEATRKEEGCIQYDLFQSQKDIGHFSFIERWESQEALDRHMKTPHFTEIVPQIRGFAAREGDGTVYNPAF